MDRTSQDSETEYIQSLEEREWEIFHQQLTDVPHSFVMENQEMLSTNFHKRQKVLLEADLDCGLTTGHEVARTRNFLAYVLFSLGKSHDALEQTHEALNAEGELHNLVSLANMAVILWQLKRHGEADEQVRRIQGMKESAEDFDYEYLVVKAKAELAFCYTRMGPSRPFVQLAEQLFSEVIPKAREADMWMWKFGLGMGLRRYLHVQFPIMVFESTDPNASQLKTELVRILRLFLEVTENCHWPTLRAMAYCEVALLLAMSLEEEILNILRNEARMSPLEAVERALQLDDNCSSVLWKSGKIYRYHKKLDKACELLEKAVRVKPTTQTYHHLGLVYKTMATRSTYSFRQRRSFQGERGGSRGRGHRGRQRQTDWERADRFEQQGTRRAENLGQACTGQERNFNQPSREQRNFGQTRREQGYTDRSSRGHCRHTYRQPDPNLGQPERGRGSNFRHRGRKRQSGNSRYTDREGEWIRGQSGRGRATTGQGYWQMSNTNEGSSRTAWRGQRGRGGRQRDENTLGRQGRGRGSGAPVIQAIGGGWHSGEDISGSGHDRDSVTRDPQIHDTGESRMEATLCGGRERRESGGFESRVGDLQDERVHGEAETSRSGNARESTPGEANEVLDTVVTRVSQLSLVIAPREQFEASGDSPPPVSRSEGASYFSDDRSSTTPARDASQYPMNAMKRIVKSPTKDATKFSWDGQYVQQAIDYLNNAVELSAWENTRAVYDLALVYRALGDLKQALNLLEKILESKSTSLGPLDRVAAYEQAGLVLKEMSEKEEDKVKKRTLDKRGDEKLNMALLTASRLFSRMPRLPLFVRHVLQSFDTLMRATDRSLDSPQEKALKKAKLFHLIKDHKHSIKLLQMIDRMSPNHRGDPTCLKMFIENHVGLQQYQEALTFIEILQQTRESGATMDKFEDSHYVQKVYILAARQALLETSIPTQRSREYFSSAFRDIYRDDNAAVTSEDSATTEEEEEDVDETWDVMIIHDDSTKRRAEKQENTALKTANADQEADSTAGRPNENVAQKIAERLILILTDVCGLKVTCMDKHVLLGKLVNDGMVKIMKKSRLIVVLAGASKLSPAFRFHINQAAKKEPTVVLLAEGSHVPKLLKTHRFMDFPANLLTCTEESLTCSTAQAENSQATGCIAQSHASPTASPEGDQVGQISENIVNTICNLFSFLTNVQHWSLLS